MNSERYIWITRWREFQHYKPNPERGPAWIKTHTAQLSDDRYLNLTDRQRSLLHDVRMVFATFRGRLAYDLRTLTRQRNSQTRHADLEALRNAGLIDIISRETLELRLEQFYGASRAEVEEEKEEDKPPYPNPAVDVALVDVPDRPSSEADFAALPILDFENVLKDIPF